MRRLGWPLTLVAALSLTACLDDPAVRERLGVDLNGSPLPGTSPSPGASPVPTPSAGASALASPTPTPSGSASAAPAAPGVTGDYRRTFDPLDLAIAGPGYFVVSTRSDPQEMQDVYFTRNGEFDLTFIPNNAGSPPPASAPALTEGVWRLEAGSGLTVVGFAYDGPDGTPVPPEGRSDYFQGAFTLGGSGATTVRAGALSFTTPVNQTIAPGFNFKGQLLNQNRPPTAPDGTPRQLYVAIAQFEHPEKLQAATGFPGYRYTPECGRVSAGIAGVVSPTAGVKRPVGDANMVRTETLER
jgi:hypothetical protein